jgi:hypothetical protein
VLNTVASLTFTSNFLRVATPRMRGTERNSERLKQGVSRKDALRAVSAYDGLVFRMVTFAVKISDHSDICS